jgi:hypothetical protein
MAYVAKFVRARLRADALYERELAAIRKVKPEDWIEFPYERHAQQTDKAVRFPTYGWLPRTAIAWRQTQGSAPGTIIPWSLGREYDQFLIARWIVDKNLLKRAITPS